MVYSKLMLFNYFCMLPFLPFFSTLAIKDLKIYKQKLNTEVITLVSVKNDQLKVIRLKR